MFRSFLSWRYLLVRRTNLIGIVGILVAVGALILILSIMTGFLEQSRVAARASSADVILTPHFGESVLPRSQSDPRRSQLTRPEPMAVEPTQLLAALRQDERIVSASAHLTWFGSIIGDKSISSQIFSQGTNAIVRLVGIDVADEFAATNLEEFLTSAPLRGQQVADAKNPLAVPPGMEGGRPRPVIVLGDSLMRMHGLSRGDVIKIGTVVFNSKQELESADFECIVGGSFRSRENELDLQRVYVDRTLLARFLAGLRSPEDALPEDARTYSEVLIKLANYERDGAHICKDLKDRLVSMALLHPFSSVETWEQQKRVILGAIENERALMAIMLSLVLLVAGFTIFAILSMMVSEKRRDIGILTALGATPRGVMQVFLMIGFWDALIGATLGCVIGTWLALKIDPIERWLSSTFHFQIFNREVYLFDYIPSQVEPLWQSQSAPQIDRRPGQVQHQPGSPDQARHPLRPASPHATRRRW